MGQSLALSALDIRRIVRNVHIIEQAIKQFRVEVVCKVKSILKPNP